MQAELRIVIINEDGETVLSWTPFADEPLEQVQVAAQALADYCFHNGLDGTAGLR